MFAPQAAVLCHSLVTLNADVLALLKEEEALLIHRCVAKADRQRRAWVNTAGVEVLAVYTNEELTWDVQAGLLDTTGLGNYHPGRALSAQSLAWANGETLPFQFKTGNRGVFVYEAPSIDPGPGDLPNISFRIRLQFGELDEDTYPDDGGPTLSAFVEIPNQTAVELAEGARNALLLDVFNGVDAFGTDGLTASLWTGDPEAGGVLQFPATAIAPWTTLAETATATSRAKNSSVIEWTATAGHQRIVTHVRLQRGTVVLRDIQLATALTVPANNGVRAPIGALGVLLTWPWDVTATAPATLPSRKYVTYAMGGSRADADIDSSLLVEFTSSDLLTDADNILVPATSEFWEVDGLTVTPRAIIGTNAAPGGGWTVGVVEAYSGGTLVMRERHAFAVAEGDVVRLIDGEPVLDLEATAAA